MKWLFCCCKTLLVDKDGHFVGYFALISCLVSRSHGDAVFDIARECI